MGDHDGLESVITIGWNAHFDSGTPETAPAAIVDEARRVVRSITARREQTARRIVAKLGIAVPAEGRE